MEFLRYFIFLYCFMGVFIAGGLFFKRRSPANVTLALYILFFTMELIDFLYSTSDILYIYPEFNLILYPVCLLFGPSLWLHFNYIKNPTLKFQSKQLLHGIPFLLFILYLIPNFFVYDGLERLRYIHSNFMNHIMPLNYIRTTHVAAYGFVMLVVIYRERLYKNNRKGIYLLIIAIIYFLTAVLQSYLTRFADNFRQFSIYFFLASTIFLIAGYVLFRYPELLEQIQEKYFNSNLHSSDKERIIYKIEETRSTPSVFLDSKLNLNKFCLSIDERPHHVSQVFSEIFETSFTHFVNKERVEVAKRILQDPSKDALKILAVAFESGFNNNVTFNKAFVKFTGMTPGQFRKKSRM